MEKRFKPNTKVVLKALPPGFLDGLPIEDQLAIRAVVGKRVTFNEYDSYGHAELEFRDKDNTIHFIFIDANFIEPC